MGFTGLPLSQSSKCKWGPVVNSPVLPTAAMISPALTISPCDLLKEPLCLYTLNKPVLVLNDNHITRVRSPFRKNDNSVGHRFNGGVRGSYNVNGKMLWSSY